jgi:hypothetical protein
MKICVTAFHCRLCNSYVGVKLHPEDEDEDSAYLTNAGTPLTSRYNQKPQY